jgi:hypothetical protein
MAGTDQDGRDLLRESGIKSTEFGSNWVSHEPTRYWFDPSIAHHDIETRGSRSPERMRSGLFRIRGPTKVETVPTTNP